MDTKSAFNAVPLVVIFTLLALVNVVNDDFGDALLWGALAGNMAVLSRIDIRKNKRAQIFTTVVISAAVILLLVRFVLSTAAAN